MHCGAALRIRAVHYYYFSCTCYVKVVEDNTSAISIAKSEESRSLKHVVNLCYHYIRFEVAQKNIIIKWIKSEDQLADFFTKVLGHAKFLSFRSKILFPLNKSLLFVLADNTDDVWMQTNE